VEEEADDLLGINQTACAENCVDSIIVTIDKDLLQIPGSHYNFVKCEFKEVTEEEGQYFFYKQLMMGDSTDNIGGCPGIGPKKAEKALEPFIGNEQMLMQAVWEMYEKCFPDLSSDECEELITTVGRLVYIRQKEGELWTIPQF
jgi:5'-3' exonuclease